MNLPNILKEKLSLREANNALRKLSVNENLIDFFSNDYLGFSKSDVIFEKAHEFLIENNFKANGATGSRLISGNHPLYDLTENYIARFHQSESALLFNSGYDANLGLLSSVPQRNDVILYDELCHASIRDGIQLSNAKAFKFYHNDVEDLEQKIIKNLPRSTNIYVVIESVYSMDGDTPNLEDIILICEKYNSYLIVDEAHALGVFGNQGEGLVQSLGLHEKVFARVMTFGKGLGCHGAAVLGSNQLKSFLVNFARSFIYTTGLSPHAIATIYIAYQFLNEQNAIKDLKENIVWFNQQKQLMGLKPMFVYSKSAIQCAIIQGNDNVKRFASELQLQGYNVKPILSPTVPHGQERLRFCLHSFNSKDEISTVMHCITSLL
jgi:8-amino-7-oxononanoate synthase